MVANMVVQTFRNNSEEPMAAQPGESRDLLTCEINIANGNTNGDIGERIEYGNVDRQTPSSDSEVFLIYFNITTMNRNTALLLRH